MALSHLVTVLATLAASRYLAHRANAWKQQHPVAYAPLALMSTLLRVSWRSAGSGKARGRTAAGASVPPSAARHAPARLSFLESLVAEPQMPKAKQQQPRSGPNSVDASEAAFAAAVPVVHEEEEGGEAAAATAAADLQTQHAQAQQALRDALRSGNGGLVSQAVTGLALLAARAKDYVTGEDIRAVYGTADPHRGTADPPAGAPGLWREPEGGSRGQAR